MNNLLQRTIVDIRSREDEITFFCNDADYYYTVEPSGTYYWIDTILAPLPVEEIIQKEEKIEVGATILIKFIDKEGNPTKGKLSFLRKE